jgi:hypothetical protein
LAVLSAIVTAALAVFVLEQAAFDFGYRIGQSPSGVPQVIVIDQRGNGCP